MYQLTPQLLNLYQDCPRCFWVEIHENTKLPSGGAGFSLQSGMYLALKKYTDGYRAQKKLPLELSKQIDGVFLPDQELVKKWRDPKTALFFEDQALGFRFSGSFDECILRQSAEQEFYIPLDFKVRGFNLEEENHDQHAQLKLDCYDLLLKKNGYLTSGTGYLVYYVPEKVKGAGIVEFNVQVIQFVSEAQRAMNFIGEVVGVLNKEIPQGAKDCEYCAWGNVGARMMKQALSK